MWKLTQHIQTKGQQDIKVKILLHEMAQYSYATFSEQFRDAFNTHVKHVTRTNNFTADIMFKILIIDNKTVEVWKLKPDGELKHKMFTLNYIGEF